MSNKYFAAAIVLMTALGAICQEAPKQEAPKQEALKNNTMHLMGLQDVKRNANGQLTVVGGAAQFVSGKSKTDVPAASIEDLVIGTETTQAGGKAGTVAKTAAIAAPYDSGAALRLLLRTKVDILTLLYRGSNGELHAALFAMPKGTAAQLRTDLVAAGARVKETKTQ